jgi:hypothetical protein
VTLPFPLFIPNTVIFHPVKSANGSLDISMGIAGGLELPISPTIKVPLNAISPTSQKATELPKSRVKILSLDSPKFL